MAIKNYSESIYFFVKLSCSEEPVLFSCMINLGVSEKKHHRWGALDFQTFFFLRQNVKTGQKDSLK